MGVGNTCCSRYCCFCRRRAAAAQAHKGGETADGCLGCGTLLCQGVAPQQGGLPRLQGSAKRRAGRAAGGVRRARGLQKLVCHLGLHGLQGVCNVLIRVGCVCCFQVRQCPYLHLGVCMLKLSSPGIQLSPALLQLLLPLLCCRQPVLQVLLPLVHASHTHIQVLQQLLRLDLLLLQLGLLG